MPASTYTCWPGSRSKAGRGGSARKWAESPYLCHGWPSSDTRAEAPVRRSCGVSGRRCTVHDVNADSLRLIRRWRGTGGTGVGRRPPVARCLCRLFALDPEVGQAPAPSGGRFIDHELGSLVVLIG